VSASSTAHEELEEQVESVFNKLNIWTFRLAKLELQRMLFFGFIVILLDGKVWDGGLFWK
jgi:hypothetical protein